MQLKYDNQSSKQTTTVNRNNQYLVWWHFTACPSVYGKRPDIKLPSSFVYHLISICVFPFSLYFKFIFVYNFGEEWRSHFCKFVALQ